MIIILLNFGQGTMRFLNCWTFRNDKQVSVFKIFPGFILLLPRAIVKFERKRNLL